MRYTAIALGLSMMSVASCASTAGSYDLRPAYLAAVAEAPQQADCGGVSDLVCECRQGGLEAELPNPSPAQFDAAYQVLAHAIENGASVEAAKETAVASIIEAVAATVNDICSYHDKETIS